MALTLPSINTCISTLPSMTSASQLMYTTTTTSPAVAPNYVNTIFTGGHAYRIDNESGKTLVCLKTDGSVVWADSVNVNEAALAFSKSIKLGAEYSVGITRKIKLDMRDSVFNDLISIAATKGALSAADLTALLEASKIIEKLKGPNED